MFQTGNLPDAASPAGRTVLCGVQRLDDGPNAQLQDPQARAKAWRIEWIG
jgi:hypothetical protein